MSRKLEPGDIAFMKRIDAVYRGKEDRNFEEVIRDYRELCGDAIARYGPRMLATLNTVSARLATGTLRSLDARVEGAGQAARLVAGSWLRSRGLIPAGGEVR